MKVDAYPESADEYAAAGLVRFAPSWLIWRSEQGGLPAAWCATRRAAAAGGTPTVICDSAKQLAETLTDQARGAEHVTELNALFRRR
jgi:hypothetical protein